MEARYGINISNESLLELHYIFKISRRNLGLRDDQAFPNFLPSQPLLINILNMSQKGCSLFYRLLRKHLNLKTSLSTRENRWHTELQQTFGIEFWNNTYNLAASIKNENKMKYLQFQINRNSLYTNYKVNKFKPHISPICTYCIANNNQDNNTELISHLFYNCVYVMELWQQIKDWLSTLNLVLPLEKNKILFGVFEESSNSSINYIILCTKYFIWRSKFTNINLSLSIFQKYLFLKLNELKEAFNYRGKNSEFDQFAHIYACLSRLQECTELLDEAPTPTQVLEADT